MGALFSRGAIEHRRYSHLLGTRLRTKSTCHYCRSSYGFRRSNSTNLVRWDFHLHNSSEITAIDVPTTSYRSIVASTIIRDSLQEGGNYENEENKSSPYEWMFIWSENTTWSAAFAILLVFGVVPLAYLLVWMASLASFPCCCRLDGSRRVMYIPEDYDKRLVRKGLL